jgi:sulfur carrier protein ThiS
VSIKQVDRKTITVTLVGPGVGTEVVELTEGSTVADLLRQTDASACHSNVFIGDKDLAEFAVLEEGMTVFLVPQPKNAADREPWRETIGMFKDNPAFEEMMQAVWAEREARARGRLDCLDRFSIRCDRPDGEQE